MAGGGLQMAGRNGSFITYLRLRALFVPLLTHCGGGHCTIVAAKF